MSPNHPLRLLGAVLAVLAVRPVLALGAALAAADLDWRPLNRTAGQHLVTPSLADACRRQGLFDRLPAEVRDYLDGIRDLNRLRNLAQAEHWLGLGPRSRPAGISKPSQGPCRFTGLGRCDWWPYRCRSILSGPRVRGCG